MKNNKAIFESKNSGQKQEKPKMPLPYLILLIFGAGFLLISILYIISGLVFPSVFDKCIGIIEINGEISASDVPATLFSNEVLGSESIAQKILEINQRPDIGAVVLIVNSPGGSVVATREIYEAYDSLSVPKVAYFREIAASGGYYIATPSDYIISEPYAITGSIGVISQSIEYSGLMEKLGINATTITSGKNKDMGSSFKPMDDEQKEIMQEISDEVFQNFKEVIILNRKEKLNGVLFENALDARILLGTQAKKIGLVDDTGTKQDAIDKAAELAGITGEVRTCSIIEGGQKTSLFDMASFIKGLSCSLNSYGLKYMQG